MHKITVRIEAAREARLQWIGMGFLMDGFAIFSKLALGLEGCPAAFASTLSSFPEGIWRYICLAYLVAPDRLPPFGAEVGKMIQIEGPRAGDICENRPPGPRRGTRSLGVYS